MSAILWLQSQISGDEANQTSPPATDFSALLEVSIVQLRRAMGAKAFHSLVFRLGRDGLPLIAEGSIVQVELPWENASVKLLVPLEHSACTCHSRELCRHKAAALVCYQLYKGRLTFEELAGAKEEKGSRWEPEQIAAAALSVRELTANLLQTGLSRLPDSAPDHAQRLSALCHTANLPRLESGLRTLGTLLERAVQRSAAFRTEDLLLRLADLYDLASRLEKAEQDIEIQELAGTFRDEYKPCPTLRLYLLGEREFHADSGYAGTVYYFWEIDQRRWYTYTVARPTFYERKGRRTSGRNPAPWGLTCLMDQLYGPGLTLYRAKATVDGRLSASEECLATIETRREAWEVLPSNVCWTDFSAMFAAMKSHLLEGAETERVVLVRPTSCQPQAFDRTAQLFRLILLDNAGRPLSLEVRYRAEEKALVQVLEGLSKTLAQNPNQPPAFLGLLRLDRTGLSLYPIESYSDWGCRS